MKTRKERLLGRSTLEEMERTSEGLYEINGA